MELCSSVLHVYRTDGAAVLRALDLVMKDAGFVRAHVPSEPVADWVASMREGLPASATYLVSDRAQDWITVIEADFVTDSPETAELAQRVSVSLQTFTLSLVVCDDMMYYNFFRGGRELDSYTSCPPHLEKGRLSEEEIESQRHAPGELLPILPVDRSISEVTALLDRGWWNAHDAGKLGESGRETHAPDGFGSERERMALFGTLLALHGNAGEYPFAAWLEDPRIDWSRFKIVAYRRAVSAAVAQ